MLIYRGRVESSRNIDWGRAKLLFSTTKKSKEEGEEKEKDDTHTKKAVERKKKKIAGVPFRFITSFCV